jgi:hypothetical protein
MNILKKLKEIRGEKSKKIAGYWKEEGHAWYLIWLGGHLHYYGGECENGYKESLINERPSRCEMEERSWIAELRWTNNPEKLLKEYKDKGKGYSFHYEKITDE